MPSSCRRTRLLNTLNARRLMVAVKDHKAAADSFKEHIQSLQGRDGRATQSSKTRFDHLDLVFNAKRPLSMDTNEGHF
jgi:hypothetical protein